MKNITTYLILMFAILFWILRIVVTILTQTGEGLIGIVSWNVNFEIVLLFVTIIFFVFIAKRIKIGALLYLAAYLFYFGTSIYNISVNASSSGLTVNEMMNLFIGIVGLIIPIAALLDMLFERQLRPKSSKNTDWFFDNKETDRKFDERADRNEYKF